MQLEDALNFDTLTANTATGDDLLYAYDRDTNTVRTISFGQALSLFGGGIASGAPVAATPGSGTLNPAGAENSILIESTNAAVLSASIAIEEDSVALTAARVGSNISIVSGDKLVMVLNGALAVEGNSILATEPGAFFVGVGEAPFDYPIFNTRVSGAPQDGDIQLSVGVDLAESAPRPLRFLIELRVDGEWVLYASSTNIVTDQSPATPEKATGWTNRNGSSGTPTITSQPATATHVIAAITAASITGITADDGEDSDGSGFVAATSTAITAPTAATSGAPPLRFDSTKLYVNVGTEAAPVWKDLTFNT
jgi:hypothetical protein